MHTDRFEIILKQFSLSTFYLLCLFQTFLGDIEKLTDKIYKKIKVLNVWSIVQKLFINDVVRDISLTFVSYEKLDTCTAQS